MNNTCDRLKYYDELMRLDEIHAICEMGHALRAVPLAIAGFHPTHNSHDISQPTHMLSI